MESYLSKNSLSNSHSEVALQLWIYSGRMKNLSLEHSSGLDWHDILPQMEDSTEHTINVRPQHLFGFTGHNLFQLFFGKSIPSSSPEESVKMTNRSLWPENTLRIQYNTIYEKYAKYAIYAIYYLHPPEADQNRVTPHQ